MPAVVVTSVMNRTVLRVLPTTGLLGSGLLACIVLLPGCRGSNASATPADGQPTKVVVATLAAYEQVTISSEGEGKVLRILADLGDRVSAGQPLVELDREKSEYRLAQQQAAVERAMAKYGVSNPEADLPAIERTPDVQ